MHTLVPSEESLLAAGVFDSRPLAERIRDVARNPSWIFVLIQLESKDAGDATGLYACSILAPMYLLAALSAAASPRPLRARLLACRARPARLAALAPETGEAVGHAVADGALSTNRPESNATLVPAATRSWQTGPTSLGAS